MRGVAPCTARGFAQRGRVRLTHRQRICAHKRGKRVAHAQARHQQFGQSFGLVGADTHAVALRFQGLDRAHRAIVQRCVQIDCLLVDLQQHRVIGINRGRIVTARAFQPACEHHAPATQRDPGVLPGDQHIAQPHMAETHVRGSDQVAGGIRKCAIEIKDNRAHGAPFRRISARLCCSPQPCLIDATLAPLPEPDKTGQTKRQRENGMSTALVILAAGKGTRMNSDIPKVLHPIAQAPMLAHAMAAGAALEPERVVVVAGHGADAVRKAATAIDPDAQVVLQSEQLGTAHAVAQARAALDGFDGDVIVLFGDTPFLKPETLKRMLAARKTHDLVVLGFDIAEVQPRYGRLIMDGDRLVRIVEYKDATESERALRFTNSGLLACDAAMLFDLIDGVGNDNAAGEYYLTEVVGLANTRGLRATAIKCEESETLGVDSRVDLAGADALFQSRARAELMGNGVTLMAPDTVYLALDTVIGRDTVIEPNVVFGPGVTVESGAHIRAFSHLEGCHVSRGAVVGPYARLRPGAELAEDTRIGNFVEVKAARIGEGAKINHLSYVGDATVGAGSNIGAGTITCNYDGVMKHHTQIGENVFVGSNTMLVAPVTLGDGAMTASGSVITRDVEADALAMARAPQEVKPGRARKLFDMLRARKARRDAAKDKGDS